jgi:HEAT repeat protein
MTPRVFAWLIPCLLVCLFPYLSACRGEFDPVIDSPMYKNPDLPVPPVVLVLPEKTTDLWIRILARPEADLRRQAADAIAEAHKRGLNGLERTIDPLVAAMDQADQPPAGRLAEARALIALDARASAPVLFRQAEAGDGDLRGLVEPALARWDYKPAREAWLQRLHEPAASRRDLVLAIQSLAEVGEGRAADRLRDLTLADDAAGPIRIGAARALGALRTDGLEMDAVRLAADAAPRGLVGRLLAALMLRRHGGDEAVKVLRRLAADPEPAVAVVALGRLAEIDAALVVPMVQQLLSSPDANLRSIAVDVLFQVPTKEHVRLLGDRLADADPGVRGRARRRLASLAADKGWRDPVIAEATRLLAGRPWQGQEQSAILLALLDHKPAAPRLVELLPSDRPEVGVTAAWALRRLAVPDTVPAVVTYVEAAEKRARAAAGRPGPLDASIEVLDHQLSQLNQLLGDQGREPAEAVLRLFLPRMEGPMSAVACPESRAAAAWALGRIRAGRPDAALASALEERLNDHNTLPPEDERVRIMAAVSLGRMKAVGSLPSLRAGFAAGEPNFDRVNNACGWAVEQITGDVVPSAKADRRVQGDWFAIPNDQP